MIDIRGLVDILVKQAIAPKGEVGGGRLAKEATAQLGGRPLRMPHEHQRRSRPRRGCGSAMRWYLHNGSASKRSLRPSVGVSAVK